MEHFYHYSLEENNTLICELLFKWITSAVQAYPISYEVIQIYSMLFHNLSCEYVLSIIQEEPKRDLFLEHQTKLLAPPELPYSAIMQVNLILTA